MEVFDLTKFRELVCDILFGGFLVHTGDHYNPSFDGCAGKERMSACVGQTVWWHIQRAARVSEVCVESSRSKTCSEVTALSFPAEHEYPMYEC